MQHMPDHVSSSAARNRWNRICKTNSKSRNKCKRCGKPKAGHNWVACNLIVEEMKNMQALESKQSDVDVQEEQPEEEDKLAEEVSLKKQGQISTEDMDDKTHIITDSLMSDPEDMNDMTYSMLFTDLDYVPVTPRLEWSYNFDFNCVPNPQCDIRMLYHQEPRLQLPSHHTRTIRKLMMK